MNLDLSSEYLGLDLRSPLVASASPCTGQPDVLRKLEELGAGAAVLPSLFEEQVTREREKQSAGSSRSEFPYLNHYNLGPDNYAALVEQARKAVAMPIVGSLNGTTLDGWVEHARRIESAGADALELNLHFVPVDAAVSSQQVEARYLDVIAAVKMRIGIPLAVKIGPYFSSLPYFARQAVDAGADGLVLFNRFLEPEVNLESQSIQPHLELSHASEARLSQRWIGVLRDQLTDCSLAASSGYQNGVEVLKAIAVGADVVMVTSVLLKQGVDYMQTLLDEMVEWMELHGYTTVRQLVGSMSRCNCHVPEAFERANYATTVASYMDQGACPS